MVVDLADAAFLVGLATGLLGLGLALRRMLVQVIKAEMKPIEYELKLNSGNSVKDQVVLLRDWTVKADARFDKIEEYVKYQHERNHEIVNHLQVIRGFHDVRSLIEGGGQ